MLIDDVCVQVFFFEDLIRRHIFGSNCLLVIGISLFPLQLFFNSASSTLDNINYHQDRKITDAHIQEVQNHPLNKLNGNFDADLEQILYQKYLTSFMQREYESYYDYRRTGYPKFPINPKTNQNYDNTKMPMRWMYPTEEYNNNRENIDVAIKSQWNGVDDVDKLIWILQK